MKIKDIYTVVPGLGTLYVVKDGTSATYQIHTEELDDRTEDYIETVAAHEDVQVMMEESRKEYQKAVQSDAFATCTSTGTKRIFMTDSVPHSPMSSHAQSCYGTSFPVSNRLIMSVNILHQFR